MRSWFVLAMLMLTCAKAVAQAQVSEAEQERRNELARIEAEAAQLQSAKADSIEKVVKLGVEDEMLEARTSLNPASHETRIILPDLKGTVRLTILGPRPNEPAKGNFFDLLQQDLTSPAAGQVYTRVSAYAGRVSIIRDSENEDWFTSIQLLQDAPPPPGGAITEPPVRLYVQRTQTDEKVPPTRFQISANTFTELRLSHLREMDEYVRPIVRDLHQQQALFAVPDAIGWVALSNNVPGDEQMMAKVQAILPQLDADDFQQRQKAVAKLADLGNAGLIALSNLDTGKLTPQQQSEIANLFEQVMPAALPQLRALANEPTFLLDLLYSEDASLRSAALKQLGKLRGHPLDATLPENTSQRDAAIDRLRGEVFPSSQPAGR